MEKEFKDMTDEELSELQAKAREEMIKYKALLKRSQTKEERHEMQTKYNAAKWLADRIKEYRAFQYELDREYISAFSGD